ncbi:MAG: hypothetical protein LWX11_04890 [Firmicutes bacterium]|nr:hypothetical protein [Bacillota bacterium]
MRLLLVSSALILTLACGSSQLSQREAASDIRKDYPVTVMIRVPDTRLAVKGSTDHARLLKMQELLTKDGWFATFRSEEGNQERFTFKPLPQAPKDFRTALRGVEIPAAQAEFVKVTGMEPTRDGAKVNYLIRLAQPTAYFPVFQALYGVKVGDTKERHALYRKEGRSWVLQTTNESFKKAE